MNNLYHEDPYLKEIETNVSFTQEEDGKSYVSLEKNIFYPQGGGQKGDRGYLIVEGKKITVLNTVKDPYSTGGVLLVVEDGKQVGLDGKGAKAVIDWDFRYKQMRLHSTVHYHHIALEESLGEKLPYPETSDIQDGFAYNRYGTAKISEELVMKANVLLTKIIEEGKVVENYPDEEKEGYRWWEVDGYKIPCGGTHIKNMNEIGKVEISYSEKKGKQTIRFSLV